jgi:flagellar FliL protein
MSEAANTKNARAAAAEAPPAEGAADGAPKKGRGKLLVILIAVVVLLAGSSAGAFFWWRSTAAASPQAQEGDAAEPAADEPEEPSGLVPLDPFIVNLAGENASQLLRATLWLVVQPKEKAKELAEDEVLRARLRSAVLEILSAQNSQRVLTAEGKAALKQAVLASVSKIVHDAKVKDVLLTDFVVQF